MSDSSAEDELGISGPIVLDLWTSQQAQEDPRAVMFLFIDLGKAALLSREQAEKTIIKLGGGDKLALLDNYEEPCIAVFADGSVRLGTATMFPYTMTPGGDC